MDYETYNKGASYLSWLLTPATVCLAIPLYKAAASAQRAWGCGCPGNHGRCGDQRGQRFPAVPGPGADPHTYVTLLPKSITTAIGMGVSEEAGGIVTLTVMSIVLTGVLGNMAGESILRLARIHHPVAKGLALGTSAHAVGTAKALELGGNRRRHEQPFHCSGRADDRDCGASGGKSDKMIIRRFNRH